MVDTLTGGICSLFSLCVYIEMSLEEQWWLAGEMDLPPLSMPGQQYAESEPKELSDRNDQGLLRQHPTVPAVAGEDTDSAVFLPVLAPCLHDAWRGEMGGRELCAEDKRELVVAGPRDALVIDTG